MACLGCGVGLAVPKMKLEIWMAGVAVGVWLGVALGEGVTVGKGVRVGAKGVTGHGKP